MNTYNNYGIKIGKKTIKYKYEGILRAKEVVDVGKRFKEAYIMALETLEVLSKKDVSENFMQLVYSDSSEIFRKELERRFGEILSKMEGARIRRRPKYVTREESNPDVLAAAMLRFDEVQVYDAFFKYDETPDIDRGGVMLHEFAHVSGLVGEENLESKKSAEALCTFAMLCSGKISEEDLFDEEEEISEGDENETFSKDEEIFDDKTLSEDDELLPYDPNQPRAPKGQSDGGQWTSQGGESSGKEKSSGDEKDSFKEKSPQNHKYPRRRPWETHERKKEIVKTAEKYVGDIRWGNARKKDNFAKSTNKCNKFVADVLSENGIELPNTSGIFGTNKPTANQLADENMEMEGWEFVNDPQPGDIIAFRHRDSNQSGHCGIVSEPYETGNRYICAGEYEIENRPINALETYHFHDKIVYRRYVGTEKEN